MNQVHPAAREWYESLENISYETALEMLETGEMIPCQHGTVSSTISRHDAIGMIKNGVKRAPHNQAHTLTNYGIVALDEYGSPVQLKTKPDPIFLCIMPTGWWWSDRTREEDGDYVQLAFLSFSRLELEIFSSCPEKWKQRIRDEAAKYQAMRGQDYQISGSGQTMRLGHAL